MVVMFAVKFRLASGARRTRNNKHFPYIVQVAFSVCGLVLRSASVVICTSDSMAFTLDVAELLLLRAASSFRNASISRSF